MYLSVFLLEAPVLLDGVEETAALDKLLPGRRERLAGWRRPAGTAGGLFTGSGDSSKADRPQKGAAGAGLFLTRKTLPAVLSLLPL